MIINMQTNEMDIELRLLFPNRRNFNFCLERHTTEYVTTVSCKWFTCTPNLQRFMFHFLLIYKNIFGVAKRNEIQLIYLRNNNTTQDQIEALFLHCSFAVFALISISFKRNKQFKSTVCLWIIELPCRLHLI